MTVTGSGWTKRHWLALGAAALVGAAIRGFYWADPGFSDDLGEFARLTAAMVDHGLGRAYDAKLSFGPVVTYFWWLASLVQPAFAGAVDSSDLGVRLLLKLPPILADFGIAALVAYALRARPTWAIVGAAIILLHPAVWFVSSWWGQYESVFTFFALLAFVLVLRDRPLLAAIAITAAILTKPQALALALPFAAWYLATYDRRTVIRAGMTAVVVAIALWLPFLQWDGPSKYLGWLAYYHDERFDVISMRAWNVWWIVQRNILHVSWVPDEDSLVGPLTYRMAGYLITVALAALVAYRVWRRP
ncbi:MAG TPA: glycosyltransferase 87 family protein, partial [Candidatus Limnocylindrales bacterium]